MHRGTPGSLSRTPTTLGALIRGSRHFAHSLLGLGRVALSDHKTCNSMAGAFSGLRQQKAGRLDGLIPAPVPSASGLSLHLRLRLRSRPLDGSGLVQMARLATWTR